VMTHRDPAQAVASVCSLVDAISGVFSDVDHREYIASHWPETLGTIADRLLDYRDAHGDESFFDVDYHELVSDPVATVSSMYDHFGIVLSEDAERAMRHWSGDHGPGEHGRHEYSLAEFGLRPAQIDERFSRYLARFEVGGE